MKGKHLFSGNGSRHSAWMMFFLLILLNSFSQQEKKTDSLRKVLSDKKLSNEKRVKTLLSLSKECYSLNVKESRGYISKAILLSKVMKNSDLMNDALIRLSEYYEDEGTIDSLENTLRGLDKRIDAEDQDRRVRMEELYGMLFIEKGNNDSAMFHLKRALQLREEMKDSSNALNIMNNMAVVYCMSGDNLNGQNMFMKCLAYHERMGDSSGITRDLSNLGLVLINLKMYEKARNDFEIALNYELKSRDSNRIFLSYINLAIAERELKNFDKAIAYNLKALSIGKGASKTKESTVLIALTSCYIEKKEYKTALGFCVKALEIEKEIGRKNQLSIINYNLSSVFYSLEDYTKSRDAALEALKYAKEDALLESQIHCYERLILSCLRLNNHREAETYFGLFTQLNDSLMNEEIANSMLETQTRYETEKKERLNKILQQENDLKQLQISSRNNTILVLGILILLIVIIVIWRINVMHLKRKKRELEALQAMQTEKQRISRDLHDNVGGQLSYML